MARTAEDGDTVKVHYTGTLDDGTVFDSSRERDPLEFELGSEQVIPGFENAVRGLEVGESVEVSLSPEEGYGHRNEELMVDVARSDLPEGLEPEVGQTLEVRTEDDEPMAAWVAEIGDEQITVDLNHPLAGRELNFEVELVDVS